MISILKLSIINIIFYISLVKVNATAISTNNHDDNIEYLDDKPFHVVVDANKNNDINKLHIRASDKGSMRPSLHIPHVAVAWETEAKLLKNSLYSRKKENENKKCLLSSLKTAIIWWRHHNGTLREANVRVLGPKRQLDLSYQNISSDQQALEILSKNFPDKKNITLTVFSLAFNNLTAVPFHTLSSMSDSLNYLSLMGNHFVDININVTDEDASHCILNVNDLKFFRNRNLTRLIASKRKQLRWATFPNMPALVELDISGCNIQYIDKEAFRNLTNLKNLYMTHNKILNIPADTFLHTPQLQVLDLGFANLHDSLIHNILSTPNLESFMKLFYGINVEQNFFHYLPNLIYLDFSHSKLRSSSAAAFRYTPPTLKYLSLCYTSLPVLGGGIFQNSSLIALDLSGNANLDDELNEHAFANLSHSLIYLFFENANLVDLSWLKPLTNLHFLALAGNSINSLSAKDFQPLKQLQFLDLSSNHVSNWYLPAFQHNENLRVLSLRNNNINFISTAMLADLSTLMYLSLGNNNFICDCVLRDLVDASLINNQQAHCNETFEQIIKKNIDINSIHLAEIVQNAKLILNTTLSTIDILSLIVSQNLYKFKEVAKKTHQTLNTQEYSAMRFILKILRHKNSSKPCLYEHNASSSHFARKMNSSILSLQLWDYKEEHYWCYNQSRKENLKGLNCQRSNWMENIEQELNTLTTYILCSVGSIFLIVVIGILFYLKRWHIYYYYSSLKSAALLTLVSKGKRDNFKSTCDQNSNLIYDIFISYCQSDRDWIVEELMPNVEKTADISICLHERDFQVGVTILDNIVSSMERSRAMMFIISSNFLLSHWCQFEMQLAHHHILDLNKDNLILVFLEEIPRSKRPKNLQFLMNVKTYIKWPGGKCKTNVNLEERKLFWRRLKHSLRNMGLNFSESKA